MLEIDGSHGEGGGQVLRYGLALSAITQRPFRIYKIRAGRKKPGLMPQHLTAVRATGGIASAEIKGDQYGSTELVFRPGKIQPGSYAFDVAEERGSAGSVCLVLQSVVPVLLLAEGSSEVTIKGGTHVPFAPIFDYWNFVFAETLRRGGLDMRGEIKRYGFYPRGGGEVVVRLRGSKPENMDLTSRGRLVKISVVSVVSNLIRNIAERQARPIEEKFTDVDCEIREVQSTGPGTYIFIRAEYEHIVAGFSALGRKGKPAEKVGQECLEQFLEFHNSECSVDSHLADQILIYLLMAKGRSRFMPSKITNHLKTGIWIINQFLDGAVTVKDNLVEVSRII